MELWDEIIKAERVGLVKKQITDRNGKRTTVWVRPKGALGLKRKDMPQIRGEKHEDFIKYMDRLGVKHTEVEVDPKDLKPTQTEVNQEMIDHLAHNPERWKHKRVWISKDNHVLDGHHRMYAVQQMGGKAKVLRIELPLKEAINMMNSFDGVERSSVEKPIDIRHTKDFDKWFKGSKVVDDQGEPQVVYHGTNHTDIKAFKEEYGRVGFFAASPQFASLYARLKGGALGGSPNVMPVYLSIKKPLDLTSLKQGYKPISPEEFRQALPPELREWAKGVYNDREWNHAPVFEFADYRPLFAEMKKHGYDAVKFVETNPAGLNRHWKLKGDDRVKDGTSYIVLESTQIKSAIGNSGKFDPNNPDITKASE